MCWRHEARKGASASGYAAPIAFESSTELLSRALTAPMTCASLRLPFLRTAVCSAFPASQTWSCRSPVRSARNVAAAVADASMLVASVDAIELDDELLEVAVDGSADSVSPPQAVSAKASAAPPAANLRDVFIASCPQG